VDTILKCTIQNTIITFRITKSKNDTSYYFDFSFYYLILFLAHGYDNLKK